MVILRQICESDKYKYLTCTHACRRTRADTRTLSLSLCVYQLNSIVSHALPHVLSPQTPLSG